MEAGRQDETCVKVRVRVRGPGPNVEGMWALPVEATDAGGTYRLANNGFLCPLVVGDVVEAQLDGDSRLQVTGVRERGGRVGWRVRFDDSADEADVKGVLDDWCATGTTVEWGHDWVSVSLDPVAGDRGRPKLPELVFARAVGIVAEFDQLSDGSTLTAADMAQFDFTLRREPSPELQPRHTTAYWVGDDPYWTDHGLDDPDFLAHVQRLAHEDVQVARALELGKHHQVLRYIEVMSMDPSQWALLPDEPIFDEADTTRAERRA